MKNWVDEDACPVVFKEILFRAAERAGVEWTCHDIRAPAARSARRDDALNGHFRWRAGAAAALLAIVSAPAVATDIVAELGLRAADEPVRQMAGWAPEGPIVVGVNSSERLARLQEAAGDTPLIGVYDEAEALAAMPRATALLGFCTRELIDAAPKLHWIQVFWAGVEDCVAELRASKRDLLLTNMQRVTSAQIAEHVMGMLLAFTRGLAPHIRAQHSGEWNPNLVPISARPALNGKTLLLVGLGGIGTAIARRAHGFDMRITAVRASGRPGPDYVAEVAGPDQLLRLAAEADVVVNSVPITDATAGMFDARFFAAMKPTAYFFNVGRGRSVVTADLVAALEAGELAGAGLDVVDPEPLPAHHPLWRMPNVIITPHVAARSDESFARVFRVLRENLRRYVNGEAMLSVVDVERGY
ncbi:MAG: NAD(P)-dependent oxidoreductase [Gammaproteobacteria bacterium]